MILTPILVPGLAALGLLVARLLAGPGPRPGVVPVPPLRDATDPFIPTLWAGDAGERWAHRFTLVVLTLTLGCDLLAASRGPWQGLAGPIPIRLQADGAVLLAGLHGLVVLGTKAAGTWMHRDPGFVRYHALILLAAAGLSTVALAGNAVVLLAGWEWIGVASALTIAHLHARRGAVRAGLRAFLTLRAPDAALGIATATLGATPFDALGSFDGTRATLVGVLLVIAAAGKSGLVPWTPWAMRAVEGPTPTSAMFYGGLGLLAGPLLLHRIAPLLERPAVGVFAALTGAVTAVLAGWGARARSDLKTSLVLSTIAQLGVSFVLFGVGVPRLALAHAVVVTLAGMRRLMRSPGWNDLGLVTPLGFAPSGLREAAWGLFRLEWITDRGVAGPAAELASQVQALDDVVPLDPTPSLDRAAGAASALDAALARSGLGASSASTVERLARFFEPLEALLAQPLAAVLLAWLLLVAVT